MKEIIGSEDRNKDEMLNIAEFEPLSLSRSTSNQNERLFKVKS